MRHSGSWLGLAIAAVAVGWGMTPAYAWALGPKAPTECERDLLVSELPPPAFTDLQISHAFAAVAGYWYSEFDKRNWRLEPGVRYSTSPVHLNVESAVTALSHGPIYFEDNRTVYLDPRWFNLPNQSLPPPTPEFLLYTVAHEVGHHIQSLRGAAEKAQALSLALYDKKTDDKDIEAVRNYYFKNYEFQADCLAGLVLATQMARGELTRAQVDAVARAILNMGDSPVDVEGRQGTKIEFSYSHGLAREREAWFKIGVHARRLEACEPYSEPVL